MHRKRWLKCIVDHEDARDGVLTWMSMLKTYKHEGDKDTKIDKLEIILETKYHSRYKGGLEQWVTDQEN